MPRITERNVRIHADEMRNSSLMLAEHDIRLSSMLEGICSDDFLSGRLLLKGGTAINKFYLKDTPRFSVDLDFNHLGSKERVIAEKKPMREAIQRLLNEDGSYHVTFRHRYEQTTVEAEYKPLFGGSQKIKIEISHVERFPILPLQRVEFTAPVSDRVVKVDGYKLDELTSTKLRAFYERLSGRDIYDLYFISKLHSLNLNHVRKMLIYYLYRSRKIFNPKTFSARINDAISKNRIEDDVTGYIRNDAKFRLMQAAAAVSSYFSPLKFLGGREIVFVHLAKELLGKQAVPKEYRPIIKGIEYPFRFLFNEDKAALSEEAWNIKARDIEFFKKKK